MTGGGCGPSTTCGNSDIHVLCACTVTISHVELTTDASSTVEHAIRNSYGGKILVDHVYQHGGTDALCWCGNANIQDSYSTIHLAISGDHLENIYEDSSPLVANHNVFINADWQTANIFGNTNNGTDGTPCANHFTITNNLLAGGGYTIYSCAHGSSVGSSTLDFENNRIARCHGTTVSAGGGHWLCSGGTGPYGSADQWGLYPDGGSYGVDASTYCPPTAGQTWSGNTWDDDGSPVSC
jgi:hypothetical protein